MTQEKTGRRVGPLAWLLITLAVVGLGVGGWMIVAEVRAARRLNAAREALGRNDVPAAREAITQYLHRHPRSAEARFLAAQAARRDGALDAAGEHLRTAGQLGWVPEAVSLERALLAVQQGEGDGFLASLHRFVEEDHPEAVRILEVLVPFYLLRFQVHEAAWAVQQWIRREPERAAAWSSRGYVAERQRNPAEAIAAFRRAVELEPEADEARMHLARWLVDKNQPAEALGHLRTLRDHRPKDAQVLYYLARTEFSLGKKEEARRTLEDLLREHPQHAGGLAERGRLELSEGHLQPAERDLRKAAELSPSERDILYQLVLCLRRVGKDSEAEATDRRRLALEDDLDRLGKVTLAIAASPRDAELRRQAGEICLRHGRVTDGLNWLQSALREDPQHAATHRLLAEHYQRVGRLELARRHELLGGVSPGATRRKDGS